WQRERATGPIRRAGPGTVLVPTGSLAGCEHIVPGREVRTTGTAHAASQCAGSAAGGSAPGGRATSPPGSAHRRDRPPRGQDGRGSRRLASTRSAKSARDAGRFGITRDRDSTVIETTVLNTGDSQGLDEAIGAFYEAVDRGETPDLIAWQDRYPELAREL